MIQSRRRVLASLIVIFLASASAGAGTMAYFSDTETSTNNRVGLGTLDLTIDGKNGETTTTLTASDVVPGGSGTAISKIRNDGSVDGYVDLELGPGQNLEGVNPDEDDGAGSGELGAELQMTIYLSEDKTIDSIGDRTVASGTFNSINNSNYNDVDWPLDGGEENYLIITWSLPTEVGNDLQGDKIRIDITVELHQTLSDPDTTST